MNTTKAEATIKTALEQKGWQVDRVTIVRAGLITRVNWFRIRPDAGDVKYGGCWTARTNRGLVKATSREAPDVYS